MCWVAVGIGMVLASLSMVCAGVLEIFRKQDLAATGGIAQDVAGTVYNASTISVLWQVPQFMLNGAGEVFTSVAGR